MNTSVDTLRSSVQQVLGKFERVKALEGTAQDSTPAGDHYVQIADEYASKGSARFDPIGGKPVHFELAEWDPNDSEAYRENEGSSNPEDSRIVTRSSISQTEGGMLYFFQEQSGTDVEGNEVWRPGPRVAVDPKSLEVVGTFELTSGEQKITPL